jgi:hypothetical protein
MSFFCFTFFFGVNHSERCLSTLVCCIFDWWWMWMWEGRLQGRCEFL